MGRPTCPTGLTPTRSETAVYEPIMAEQTEVPTRRHMTERQAEQAQRLVDAAALEVEDRDYDAISVRTIAKRAGLSTATAYTYFSSKDHLLAEVLWRRIGAVPPPLVDLSQPVDERVGDVIRAMGVGFTGSPAVIGACTTALLGSGPEVMAVRARIGLAIQQRLEAALGPDADPAVLRVLTISYTGAILVAGMGHLTFEELPERLAEAARLLTRETL
jgi:AcrR family transcriptional regulator